MKVPTLSFDDAMKFLITASLFAWVWLIGSHMKTPYPSALVDAYALPLTRFIGLAFVLVLVNWCPSAGILAAMAYIFLGADVINLVRS